MNDNKGWIKIAYINKTNIIILGLMIFLNNHKFVVKYLMD